MSDKPKRSSSDRPQYKPQLAAAIARENQLRRMSVNESNDVKQERAVEEMRQELQRKGNKNPSEQQINRALHQRTANAVKDLQRGGEQLSKENREALARIAFAYPTAGETRAIKKALREQGLSEREIEKIRRTAAGEIKGGGSSGGGRRARDAREQELWRDGGVVESKKWWQ